jgi:hypothetical protein
MEGMEVGGEVPHHYDVISPTTDVIDHAPGGGVVDDVCRR